MPQIYLSHFLESILPDYKGEADLSIKRSIHAGVFQLLMWSPIWYSLRNAEVGVGGWSKSRSEQARDLQTERITRQRLGYGESYSAQ